MPLSQSNVVYFGFLTPLLHCSDDLNCNSILEHCFPQSSIKYLGQSYRTQLFYRPYRLVYVSSQLYVEDRPKHLSSQTKQPPHKTSELFTIPRYYQWVWPGCTFPVLCVHDFFQVLEWSDSSKSQAWYPKVQWHNSPPLFCQGRTDAVVVPDCTTDAEYGGNVWIVQVTSCWISTDKC